MIKIAPRAIMVLVSTLLFLLSWSSYAQKKDQYQQKIDSIAKQIVTITKNLNTNKARLQSERDELLKQERTISQLNTQIDTLEKTTKNKENEIVDLTKQEQRLQQQSKADRATLQMLIEQRYMRGNSHYLKMLLDQKNPYAVGRLQNYYDYFHQAQQQKLTILRAQASQLALVRQDLNAQQKSLKNDIQELRDKRYTLGKSQKNREKIVTKLSARVEQGNKDLGRLKADRQRLSSLLKQLAVQAAELERIEQQRRQSDERKQQQVSRDNPQVTPIKGGFLKQKGRLKPPVRGSLKYKYGSRLAESGMRAEGLFFNTGQPRAVHSIFSGRVLFADFLKGYGLLIIIEHGDQHISLYGHNELLYKKVGDMVATDEVISKSGTTGGLKKPGLYFEIRKNATPVDPALWCQI